MEGSGGRSRSGRSARSRSVRLAFLVVSVSRSRSRCSRVRGSFSALLSRFRAGCVCFAARLDLFPVCARSLLPAGAAGRRTSAFAASSPSSRLTAAHLAAHPARNPMRIAMALFAQSGGQAGGNARRLRAFVHLRSRCSSPNSSARASSLVTRLQHFRCAERLRRRPDPCRLRGTRLPAASSDRYSGDRFRLTAAVPAVLRRTRHGLRLPRAGCFRRGRFTHDATAPNPASGCSLGQRRFHLGRFLRGSGSGSAAATGSRDYASADSGSSSFRVVSASADVGRREYFASDSPGSTMKSSSDCDACKVAPDVDGADAARRSRSAFASGPASAPASASVRARRTSNPADRCVSAAAAPAPSPAPAAAAASPRPSRPAILSVLGSVADRAQRLRRGGSDAFAVDDSVCWQPAVGSRSATRSGLSRSDRFALRG